MNDTEVDTLAVFREVNVEGTRYLAEQAASYGIKRFIYISSIKVNGEGTNEQPFKADDIPAPEDAYGISKWEAEQVLQKIACNSKLEIVIIRPPLVYGPEVQANFLKLMKLVKSGLPLPLGAIRNSRSFVALDNLVDLISTCLQHPAAIDQTFLVSDGDDLSTPELLWRTAKAFGKSSRLIPIPVLLLKAAALLLGKKDFFQRLCGSLQIDIGKTRQLLGWTPKVSVDAALLKTTKHFLEITGRH
jgi:nucleoside-diphosphate-sugar epimerase